MKDLGTNYNGFNKPKKVKYHYEIGDNLGCLLMLIVIIIGVLLFFGMHS